LLKAILFTIGNPHSPSYYIENQARTQTRARRSLGDWVHVSFISLSWRVLPA